MKKRKIIFTIAAFCLLILASCANGTNQDHSLASDGSSEIDTTSPSAANEERVYYADLPEEEESLYQRLTGERALKEWQIHSLESKGFSFQEILSLPDEEIAKMLAPGSGFMGDYLTEEEFQQLIDSGMPEDDVYVLNNLGFDYESITALSPEQLEFIFPNTELVDNIVALGYDRDLVETSGFLYAGGWETYKELLDEIFENHFE